MNDKNTRQQRTWSKSGENIYALTSKGEERGTLTITRPGKEACVKLGKMNYSISSKGLLKYFLEVTDEKGNTVLKITQDNWYSSKWEMVYNFKKYRLEMKSFSLACYKLYSGENEVLSYGIKTEKCRVVPDIKSNTNDNELLLDFVLWFLLYPILFENSDTDLLLLTTSIA